MTFDLFAILTMLFKYKQAFSKARFIISACQSNLSSDIIERNETFQSLASAIVIKIKALALKEINS